MKRVAAGILLPTSWLSEPAKRSDDRTNHRLGCSFFPWCEHQLLFSVPISRIKKKRKVEGIRYEVSSCGY